MRDQLIAALSKGPASIAEVARRIAEERPVHRLTVAGYLAAMEEEGVLRSVPRGPSRQYMLQDPATVLTLHQRVGALGLPPETGAAVLQTVLGRPLFIEELRHARIPAYHLDTQPVDLGTLRGPLAGAPYFIDVPPRANVVGYAPGDPRLADPAICDALRELVIGIADAENVVGHGRRRAAASQKQSSAGGEPNES